LTRRAGLTARREGERIRRHLVILLVLAAVLVGGCGNSEGSTPTPVPKTYPGPPPLLIDTGRHYTATIETEKGNLILELFAKDVPVTVNNFVFLARDGFYDGTTYYRVVPGFMAQAGDPTGTGTYWPGYFIPDEFSRHTHVAGALSMANMGAPNTGTCHFFITYVPRHDLDNGYSVFGQLVEGMDVLRSLTPGDPVPSLQGDKILRVTIDES
jgi:cyclophilin family peptidyl-prolyl cis-trans isomerase